MDWIALKHDPLWRGFWNSPEIQAQKKALLDTVLAGNWNEKELERIKGQLKVLDGLPKFADLLAEAQERAERRNRPSPTEDPRMAELLSQMPEIL